MFESIYGSSWHHPYFFWAVGVPLLGLLGLRASHAEGRAAALAWLLVAFQIGILSDAWLTAPHLSPLTGSAAEIAAIAFVVLGDARYFLLLERFGRPRALRIAALRAMGWGLAIPVTSLVAKSWSSDARVLFFTYEVMFALLASGLAVLAIPRLPAGPERDWLTRLTAFEIVQYAFWAFADALILTGFEVGFLLRLVPNAMYYVAFVPFAWRTAPGELRA